MKFIQFILPAALIASVHASDAKTVRSDLANITTLLAALDTDVKAVHAGPASIDRALQVQVDAVNLHKQLVIATDDAKASPPFGGDSLGVGLDFINLSPKVQSTLKDVSAQKANFSDLGVVVLSSLYQLKQDTDALGAAAIEKLDALERLIAPGIIKSLDDAFNNAIVTYGGKAT